MTKAPPKYVLRIVFSPDQAHAISKLCEARHLPPEAFVRYATLNALTTALLSDGLPDHIRDELREWAM